MVQDPNELSAGLQQSGSGDPALPLTRRELRQSETELSDDYLAIELERQMQGWLPPSLGISVTRADVEDSFTVDEAVVFSGETEAPVLMLRDRSNRPPLVEQFSEPEAAPGLTSEFTDPVTAEADKPIRVMQSIPQPGATQMPVITEAPESTATLPAPISLIGQTPTLDPSMPSAKVHVKSKRRSPMPQIVVPQPRKRRGAQVFSMVAMAFVAGLAIATSVPANALLSPEQVALQAELARTSTLAIGDGQSVEGTGENVNAGRDGVSVSAAQAVPTAGAYAPKKLNVNVPVSSNGMRWPVDQVKISSPFGERILWGTYNFHTGLDFDPDYGSPIYSVADGIVSLVEDPGPTCGVAVFIEHNVDGLKFTSVYCHMVIGSPTVTAGETVKKGDLIGNIGLTGITTGPHLHLEIRVADSPVDPYSFLVQHAGKASNEVRS